MRAFYYDIVCPYAYMAFSFLHRSGVFKNERLELRPILLGGLFKHMGIEANPNLSLQPFKARYFQKDIERQANYFSAPLKFHPRHPVRTVEVMRLLYGCDERVRLDLTKRLYEAYWQENEDIDQQAFLQKIAKDFLVGDLESCLESGKQALINATNEAFSAKVFGVPTIALNDRLYFGSDRLALIAEELQIKLPDAKWAPSKEPIELFFDFASPYSFLGWVEVRKAINMGVKFKLRPILLGGLFKEIGTAGIPMLSAHPNKTSYFLQDMNDWARHRSVSFRFSPYFPLRTIIPLRLALVDENVIDPIFTAAWAQGLDIGDKGILTRVLDEAGFNSHELLLKAEDETIKEKLKANTKEAISRNVFGVPTFFVGETQIFGQDRFFWIRQELKKHEEKR